MGLEVESTFYDVMKLQAWLEEDHFAFETIDSEDGKIVTSIGGLANDYQEKVGWQLFIVPEYPADWWTIPDDSYRATKPVDKIVIEDGQHFYFIYLEIRNEQKP